MFGNSDFTIFIKKNVKDYIHLNTYFWKGILLGKDGYPVKEE